MTSHKFKVGETVRLIDDFDQVQPYTVEVVRLIMNEDGNTTGPYYEVRRPDTGSVWIEAEYFMMV